MAVETSIKAYKEIIAENILGKQMKQVSDYIHANPHVTDKEISAGTALNINAVTGRRNALFHLGVVETSGKRKCSVTGRSAFTWHVPKQIKLKTIVSGLTGSEVNRVRSLIQKADQKQLMMLESLIKSKLYRRAAIQSNLGNYGG